MPGARCTRGLVCKRHMVLRTRAYRYSRNTPAFPAQWLYGLCRALVSAKSARMCERAVLANRPSLVLADEPTGNLDEATADVVFMEFVKLVRDEGSAALVATHNERIAAKMDRVVRLHDGVLE